MVSPSLLRMRKLRLEIGALPLITQQDGGRTKSQNLVPSESSSYSPLLSCYLSQLNLGPLVFRFLFFLFNKETLSFLLPSSFGAPGRLQRSWSHKMLLTGTCSQLLPPHLFSSRNAPLAEQACHLSREANSQSRIASLIFSLIYLKIHIFIQFSNF